MPAHASHKEAAQVNMAKVERVIPNALAQGPSHRLGDKPIHHGTSSKRRTSNAQHPMPKFGAEKTNESGTQEWRWRDNGAECLTDRKRRRYRGYVYAPESLKQRILNGVE
jgi:hypothetical protein